MKKFLLPILLMGVLCLASCKQKEDNGEEGETIEMKKWNIADIRIRDPYILRDDVTEKYYLYAQKENRLSREVWDTMPGVEVYSSIDLKSWSGPKDVFTFPEGFWADYQVWAPEGWKLHKRGTQVLVSDSPEGPFQTFDNKPHTPESWSALDGTLWVENEIPYMIFCHEWLQITNGSMEVVQLAEDLSKPVTDPVTLFHAGDADWVMPGRTGSKVTDGCFLYETMGGKLIMIWSSFGENGYAVATAVSENGSVAGPWKQSDLLFQKNGGHGMIFETFEGELCLVFHQPNRGPEERAQFYKLSEKDDKLILGEEYFLQP